MVMRITTLQVDPARADVTASDTSGYYQEQIGKARPYLTAPPQREVYEATLQV